MFLTYFRNVIVCVCVYVQKAKERDGRAAEGSSVKGQFY